ncbi:MAG: M56 family peptidase [Bacteroidia bacterium]|nr:MAG: M56 family peptidase [Bacteroidia bacterium]
MKTMNDLANYIFESGICLAVLFALYWLLLRKETYFQFNRFYLLGTLVVSCLLPLGSINIFSPEISPQSGILRMLEAIRIPELTIAEVSNHAIRLSNSWQTIIIIIYLLGASTLIFRTILGITKVTMLIRKGSRINLNGYSIVHLPHPIAPFSFANTIFLTKTLIDNDDESHIINHEVIHIKQLHTCDKLFVEIFLAVFWFNPFTWLIRRALRNTHEYLADYGVINKTHSLVNYQSLLLNQVTGILPVTVINSFNSNIKNRIKMMCRDKSSNLAKFKPLLFIPVLACLTLLFACNENADNLSENNDLEMTPQQPEFPEGEELYFVVEEMPKFKGQDPAMEFRKYIAQNLRYPKAEAEDSITGRVIVQFTVNKEGNVVNAVVVRGVDPYLDDEAIRVISSSPKWTPGKQDGKEVNVLYTFPINFIR